MIKSPAITTNRPELPNRSNTEAVENMKAASTPIWTKVVTAMTCPGDLELASTAEYRAVRRPPDTPTRLRNTHTPSKSFTITQAALPAMATKMEANATGRQPQRRCQYKPDSEPTARPANSIAATAPSRVAVQCSCAQPSSIAGVMRVPIVPMMNSALTYAS